MILLALVGQNHISLKTWGLYTILLALIFPASNGYNSFYDRDQESIGGLEVPPPITVDLLLWSLALESLALSLVFYLEGFQIFGLLFLYGIVSKLYSHPRTRWKANPWLSTLSVCFFQGALIFFVMKISLGEVIDAKNILGAFISTLFIAAAYPITQIYQHDEDARRGDLTLSRVLGIERTFFFSLSTFILSEGLMLFYFRDPVILLVLLACNLPAIFFLFRWMRNSQNNLAHANFRQTHRFLGRLTVGSHLGFGIILIMLSAPVRADFIGKSQEPWFTLIVKETGSVTSTKFLDTTGKILSQETVEKREDKLYRYEWIQKQSGDKFVMQKEGDEWKANFNGDKQNISLKDHPDLIVPPMIAPELLARIKKDPKMKEWNFELFVPDKLMVISFEFRREGHNWNLRPSNFFVRAVVGTIPFVLNSEGKLAEIRKFTPPVRFERKNNSWETRTTNVEFQAQ